MTTAEQQTCLISTHRTIAPRQQRDRPHLTAVHPTPSFAAIPREFPGSGPMKRTCVPVTVTSCTRLLVASTTRRFWEGVKHSFLGSCTSPGPVPRDRRTRGGPCVQGSVCEREQQGMTVIQEGMAREIQRRRENNCEIGQRAAHTVKTPFVSI